MLVVLPSHNHHDGLRTRGILVRNVPDPPVKAAGPHHAFFGDPLFAVRLPRHNGTEGSVIPGPAVSEVRVIEVFVEKVFHLLAGKSKSNARVSAHEIPPDGRDLHAPYGEKPEHQDHDGHQDFDERESSCRTGRC